MSAVQQIEVQIASNDLPFRFCGAPKIFDTTWFLETERAVLAAEPLAVPKMSLLPPPGGFRTLKQIANKNGPN